MFVFGFLAGTVLIQAGEIRVLARNETALVKKPVFSVGR
jgi:hypothetical protein